MTGLTDVLLATTCACERELNRLLQARYRREGRVA